MSKPAKVYLVGAGPGDPGLITRRGLECLRRADLLLYDYLVNPRLLDDARPEAEKFCLGRHGQGKLTPQATINQRMVEAALAGRTVVRLKGGDPSVFGHLAEEVDALTTAGLEFEVVPGITTALAAASYAGLAMTDRTKASAVALVTGHETPGKTEDALDYAALAAFPGTLVVYMGVTTAPAWISALIAAGKPPETPAVIVRRCSWPQQRTVGCRLDEVAGWLDQNRPDKIRPPAVVVVGDVAVLQKNWDWFGRRPLSGMTVLAPRAVEQAGELTERLEELGAEVLRQPAIEIAPPSDPAPLDAAIERLEQFDWIVFSSPNGVRGLLDRLLQRHDVRRLGRAKLAVVGPGTAAELARYHLKADLTPDEHRAEGLLSALAPVVSPPVVSATNAANRSHVLLVRASRGREILGEGLRAAGADVTQVVAYESRDAAHADPEIRRRMAAGEIDFTLATSSAVARSLVHLFEDDLARTRLVAISPITSATLGELGRTPVAEAAVYTMPGLVDALLSAAAELRGEGKTPHGDMQERGMRDDR